MSRRLVFDNSAVPDVLALHVSKHAMDAYELFYPLRHLADNPERAGRVLDAIATGVPLPLGEALRLVGRSVDRPDAEQSAYVLHQERTGIFVIARNRNRGTGEPVVVTFLRFVSYLQHTMACDMYGRGTEPTGTNIPWRERRLSEREVPAKKDHTLVEKHDGLTIVVTRSARRELGSRVDEIAADMVRSNETYKAVDGKLLQLYRSDSEYRVSFASLSVSASRGINSRIGSEQARALAMEMLSSRETTRSVEGLGTVNLVSTPGKCRLSLVDSEESPHAENGPSAGSSNEVKREPEEHLCPAGVPWGDLRVSHSLTEDGSNRYWRFRKLLSEQTWEPFRQLDPPHLDELVFRIVLPDNRVVWVVRRLAEWCAVPKIPADVPEHFDMARKLIAAGWTCRPPDVVDEAEGDPEAT